MNFGIIEDTYGTPKIPTYEQYLINMQLTFKNMGAKMTLNEDGSATAIMNGKTAIKSESELKAKYDVDVAKWKAKGFEF